MLPALQSIGLAITVMRGQRVIFDSDLAELYGVETKRFNEAVKRNTARFPADFIFRLTAEETDSLRSQIATLKTGRGQHRKYLPYVFTEHGAIMAAMILNSSRAVQVALYVVRAFVRLRAAAAQHQDLAKQLAELQDKTESLAMSHDSFSRNTRNQLRQVFDTLRELPQYCSFKVFSRLCADALVQAAADRARSQRTKSAGGFSHFGHTKQAASFARLTMRGDVLFSVRTALSLALACSSCLNQRFLAVARFGGGP